MKIKTPILLPLKSQKANATALWVDINYANSFCEHLKEGKINFKRSSVPTSENGSSKDLKIDGPIGNEIIMEYTGDVPNLLVGWGAFHAYS